MASIQSVKTYIPGIPTPVGNLQEKGMLDDNSLTYFNSCGIETVYEAGNISSYELARGASERLLEETGTDPLSIDLIIYIQSRMPQQFISSESTRLQQDIKAHKALSFAVSNLGCADSSMALQLAKDYLTAHRRAEKVLICYGNKLLSPYRFRYPVTIMGDGGVAALITRATNHTIRDIQIESNGYYWDLFSLDYQDRPVDQYRETCSDIRKYGFELAIESKNRFSSINETLLQRNGLSKDDIRHYMLQNISSRAYEYYQSAFDIRISPVCPMNLTQYGHLGAGDIFLNYQTGVESGLLQTGDRVLLMNNSPAAAWSSVLVEV